MNCYILINKNIFFLKSDNLFTIQSTFCRWPLLFSIFPANVGYHLEKTMRFLR